MKVELTYFKRSGKYYTDGETQYWSDDDSLYDIWDWVDDQRRAGNAPGLNGGGEEFFVLVNVPEHRHAHPKLLLPLA